jgi:two-component system, chemotaxis family, protein-glutamate methylesterase/glutaminase
MTLPCLLAPLSVGFALGCLDMSAMRAKRAVAIGASAGGVEALRRLFTALPRGLPAPTFVVLHISPAGRSLLADIIGRTTVASVVSAEDGMPVQDGTVYVAPPDRHLIVEDGHVRLTRQPRENGHRPAIDVTFRSVAAAYRSGTIGVVLSGTGDDGSAGLREIKRQGGTALVQDPKEALYDAMPVNALEAATADAVLPVDQLARRLTDLLSTSTSPADQSSATAQSDDPPDRAPRLTRPSGRKAGDANGAIGATARERRS